MDKLKEKFEQTAAPVAQQIKELIRDHGDHVIGQYTIEQVYHGMKGMIGMVTETSKLDPEEGIRFRKSYRAASTVPIPETAVPRSATDVPGDGFP